VVTQHGRSGGGWAGGTVECVRYVQFEVVQIEPILEDACTRGRGFPVDGRAELLSELDMFSSKWSRLNRGFPWCSFGALPKTSVRRQ